MRESFNIFHWEFYKDEGDSTVYVYENRSGDVIGYLPYWNLDMVKNTLDNKYQLDEHDVYNFIETNIEWY